MTQRRLRGKQEIQEVQYEYPYHYIPKWENGVFSQLHYWSWGFRYLGGMQVVLDQLARLSFGSVVDIGCGDGRFLREVAKRYPNARLLGVDVSERAIQLARAMNPTLEYKAINIVEESLPDSFDVVTLIEVLEHIPPQQVASFLKAVVDNTKDSGWLVLTVPHANVAVLNKHYQHFTSHHLQALLSPYFQGVAFIPFDVRSKVMAILQRLIGGRGHHFVLTNARLLSWFYQLYSNRYLYSDDERKCSRIAAVCWK